MKTLGEILTLSAGYLKEQKISSARLHAEELLADVLGVKRLDLYMQFDRPLLDSELEPFRAQLKRRAKGEPLEYLLSQIEFFGCTFKLTPDVLIPRQETEILLSKAVDLIAHSAAEGGSVWDICTGSGCLGVALKKRLPHLNVLLSDFSEQALEVAMANAERNQVDVTLLQGDLLKPFSGKRADFVICNPPYISSDEYLRLDREVKEFEPKMALTSGTTGFEFYERLSKELPDFLNPKAQVFFEIGKDQAEGVLSLFNAPCWKNKRVEKDWAGHDRFFFLEFQ
ncbi:MAG: peptide chain release factor N(5)-glutamine methyltransferase [Chlamydiales bacterium]|nr:peptide chain release factor N(5)-glutamine methyltransferase [Chlamydiales bacterium]